MMTQPLSRTLRTVALFLIFSILPIGVQADLVTRYADADQGETKQAGQIMGKLSIRGDKPVLVNGVDTKSGNTIFSGAQIQTPLNTSARIQLPSIGTLDVAVDTNLKLTFSAGNVEVVVIKGCVKLTTLKGVNGSVQIPQGAVERTDSTKESTIEICTSDRSAGAYIPAGGLIGLGTAAAIGGAGAGATAFILATRGADPSPITP